MGTPVAVRREEPDECVIKLLLCLRRSVAAWSLLRLSAPAGHDIRPACDFKKTRHAHAFAIRKKKGEKFH